MVHATSAGATPLHRALPEEIIIWEILVLLPPKSLLRCRAVCRAWQHTTSTHEFLLAHHGRQPSLNLTISYEAGGNHILAFDHRDTADARLHTVARLDWGLHLEASCDGLLVMCKPGFSETSLSICNPTTRQYASLGRTRSLIILGMYPHRPTGEYRLLLYRCNNMRCMLMDLLPQGQIGCYVLALCSDQPARYIGWPGTGPELRVTPTLIRDKLHWFVVQDQSERKIIIVFDTIAESFLQMRAPIVPAKSNIFEMDGTLGIYTTNIYATKIVDIWVLQNYESEVWDFKYRIELPVAEIRGRFEHDEYCWDVKAVSRHGEVILFVSFGSWLHHVDNDGKLVASFPKDKRRLGFSDFWLKQTLVPHTFFMPLEGHVVKA